MKRLNTWLLRKFNNWFCSAQGVLQTTVIVMAVVVMEFADRGLDPHAFILMAVLTVYSAITQPALAYAGRTGAEQMEEILIRLERMELTELAELAAVLKGNHVSSNTGIASPVVHLDCPYQQQPPLD